MLNGIENYSLEKAEEQVKKFLLHFKCEIRELRRYYGLTQKQVAEKIGVATQCYQAYESGVSVPTLQNFIKLAILFDTLTDELLGKPL